MLICFCFFCRLNGSADSNSSDDGDCDAPSASSAAYHANALAHRMLSPVRLNSSNESNCAENSLKLDFLV